MDMNEFIKIADMHSVCDCDKCKGMKADGKRAFEVEGLYKQPKGTYWLIDEAGNFIDAGNKVDISSGMPQSYRDMVNPPIEYKFID